MTLDDLAYDVEPQAEAGVALGRYGALEAIEDAPDVFRADSQPMVVHRELGISTVARNAHFDRVGPHRT